MQVGPPPSCPHRRAGRVNDKKVNEENSIKKKNEDGSTKERIRGIVSKMRSCGIQHTTFASEIQGLFEKKSL